MRKNFLHAQFYQLHLKKNLLFYFLSVILDKKIFFQIISVIHDQINNSFYPDSLTLHQETFSLPTATNFHKPARENRNPAAENLRLTPLLFRAKVKKSNAMKRNSRIPSASREPLGGAKRLQDRSELASEQRAEPQMQ